ncbi:MAG TPA: hypothetical protein VGS07_34065 [Thermoanaerobaculia bacterium]|jgi:hypothetical protein|nr:hypothetical protein [Thermoanaerobaculia bacterium]
MTVARYTFLPWLRRGLGNRIQAGAGAGSSRATLTVSLAAKSDAGQSPVPPVTVKLVGPGDIAGMHPQQVFRTEPRALATDFEPNYLAAIDLYDEDFPWRYSPVAVDGATHHLLPWIALVVLKDEEFKRSATPGRPLPAFVLTPQAKRGDLFPKPNQEWAWAHVHLNADLANLGALKSVLDGDPDAGYARLMCPRKLDPNTGYTAFVVPVFEVGRKAGLGEKIGDAEDGTVRSWAGPAAEFPIYYEWFFRTGVEGDFEALVHALVPRDMDPRVGIRDMDITHPGFGVADVANPPDGFVGLEGALLAPTTVAKGLSPTSDFVARVEPVLNKPAEARAAGEKDPVVAPPIHGCWHAQVERVSAAEVGWVNTLNLDPRHRAAAGLGVRVVRAHQEEYMRLAWEGIGDVITINHKVRRAQLATKASASAYSRTVAALPAERATALMAPVFGKVLGSPVTLRALVGASRVPQAALSPALRKLLRPRGLAARQLLPESERIGGVASVLSGLSAGTLSAAPPRAPAGGATLEAVTATLAPAAWLAWLRRNGWWLALLALLIVIALLAAAPALGLVAAVVAGVAGAVAVALVRASRPAADVVETLSPAGLTPDAILAIPASPSFTFTSTIEPTLPASAAPAPTPPLVAGDNAAAADLRRALLTFQERLAVRIDPLPPKPALDLPLVHAKALAAIEPHRAMAARFAPLLRIGDQNVHDYARSRYGGVHRGMDLDLLREVMKYPDLKMPMYFPLDKLSDEYFVPNLKLIPNNTISLMKTNQPFIESYFVGLNHEFARELLWREYPTDQQGSYFRQFWDVSNFVDLDNRDAKTLAEDLKDIPPIHQWRRPSALGSHNKRDAQGDAAQVVLVIRGDLLKRYPNTYIYAQQAKWGTDDRANRLVLSDEKGELFAQNKKDPALRFPLYRARVAPDIHFIGFDLTLDDVRGDSRLDETAAARAAVDPKKLGWFFVLQEVVGEPRFGLDVAPPVKPEASQWDNLSWVHLDLSGGQAIDVLKALKPGLTGVTEGVTWGANAADMAFILYQKPVMVAIHGRNMLQNLQPAAG